MWEWILRKVNKEFNILSASQRTEKKRIEELRKSYSSDIERWTKTKSYSRTGIRAQLCSLIM
jgi:hypothetical protein